jgi:hypothetical protein
MARWKLGDAEVEALLAAGELQKLTGDAANGERLMDKASTTLVTARSAIDNDPDSAFVLAYDAARQALTGFLAQQGLIRSAASFRDLSRTSSSILTSTCVVGPASAGAPR